jgi:hypothetical protein
MKKLIFFALFSVLVGANATDAYSEQPSFEKYAVSVFTGEILTPTDFKVDKNGIWRDSVGKMIEEPHVNFSGKYFLSKHSCGTECRYYLLSDLTTGKHISDLDMFANTDPPSRTKEGFRYMTNIHFVKSSSMLVAQYEIQKNDKIACKERVFVFDGASVRPISSTKNYCSKILP